jgi:hypothetical protein
VSGQELERLTSELLVPLTGEVVPLRDPPKVARALLEVRRLKAALDEARATLEDALVVESEPVGSRTLRLGEQTAVVSGGTRTEFDAVELAQELRAVGLPEGRVTEVVRATVTYSVDARVARSLAAANPRYAAAIERCRRTVAVPSRVAIKEGATR